MGGEWYGGTGGDKLAPSNPSGRELWLLPMAIRNAGAGCKRARNETLQNAPGKIRFGSRRGPLLSFRRLELQEVDQACRIAQQKALQPPSSMAAQQR